MTSSIGRCQSLSECDWFTGTHTPGNGISCTREQANLSSGTLFQNIKLNTTFSHQRLHEDEHLGEIGGGVLIS